jgi:ribosome-associated protein
MTAADPAHERARQLALAAQEKNAADVVALDVRALTSFADSFVLATATSDRQARAIADHVMEAAHAHGLRAIGSEGYEDGRWILLDLNEIVVHVFVGEAREHYDLDRLWADAVRIALPHAPAGAREARA